MASESTLEQVVWQLHNRLGELESHRRRLASYASEVELAIATPVTGRLVEEAGAWVAAVQKAQDAVWYWIRDIQNELESIRALEATP